MADETGGAQSGTGVDGVSGSTDTVSTGNNTGTPGEGAQSGADTGGTAPDTVSRAEYDRVLARMQAADRRATESDGKLKQLVEKDLPEAERTRKQIEELTATNTKLQEDLEKARVENAFLADNTHKWHDPKMALKNVDLSAVQIDSEGNVTGLKEALAALAKNAPWMLAPKPAASDEDGGDKGPAPTFTPPAGNGKPGPDKQRAASAVRFPALRSRGINS